jgi:hypothetical protein
MHFFDMEKQQINLNTVEQAIKDGSIRDWDVESLQLAIGVELNSGGNAFDAGRISNHCKAIHDIIHSKEEVAGRSELMGELGKHNKTARDGVCWARIAAWAAIAAVIVGIINLFK